MSNETLITRPRYGQLKHQEATLHLLIADTDKLESLQSFLDELHHSGQIKKTHFIYISPTALDQKLEPYSEYSFAHASIGPTYNAIQSRYQHCLKIAPMGTLISLFGSESMIGLATRDALEANISLEAIQTQHYGSQARRVQCVHCKGITEKVTHDPYTCQHCGLHLFVRDHYSRRLAAFQGVRVDAENPGNIPPSVEKFL